MNSRNGRYHVINCSCDWNWQPMWKHGRASVQVVHDLSSELGSLEFTSLDRLRKEVLDRRRTKENAYCHVCSSSSRNSHPLAATTICSLFSPPIFHLDLPPRQLPPWPSNYTGPGQHPSTAPEQSLCDFLQMGRPVWPHHRPQSRSR